MIGYDFKTKPCYPKANADLRASTSVEIHYIDKDHFIEILKAYPKFSVYFNEVFKPEYSLCDEMEVKYSFSATYVLHIIIIL